MEKRRASILNIKTNFFLNLKFSVSVYQICVLDTKKLVVAYSFSLGERLTNVLKTSQSDMRSVKLMGRPEDVNLIIIHKGTSSGRCVLAELLHSNTLVLIIQVTANFALAFSSNPITW